MRPIETKYKGCRFRSRLEARWAVFFDALGIKWRYEPEGFIMRFDYEAFAAEWDMSEDKLLSEGVPETFKHLDGREYMYLPDFYLPDLNYWIEIKGFNPTREEVEKAFILDYILRNETRSKLRMAKTEADELKAFKDLSTRGVFILYGDIPYPYPQKGNIFGYGLYSDVSKFEGSTQQAPFPHRALLMGRLNLCWQECPLCSKVGIGRIEAPYCTSCYDRMAMFIVTHLIEDWGIEGPILPILIWETPHLEESQVEELQVNSEATNGLMNRKFFTSGHRMSRLQEAYEAARSARFEHR